MEVRSYGCAACISSSVAARGARTFFSRFLSFCVRICASTYRDVRTGMAGRVSEKELANDARMGTQSTNNPRNVFINNFRSNDCATGPRHCKIDIFTVEVPVSLRCRCVYHVVHRLLIPPPWKWRLDDGLMMRTYDDGTSIPVARDTLFKQPNPWSSGVEWYVGFLVGRPSEREKCLANS